MARRVQFATIDRDTPNFLPASVQDYIPENHLARFIVEIVEQLDLKEIDNQYGGRGSKPWPPNVMVALLFYGYATGVFSSGGFKIELQQPVIFGDIPVLSARRQG